MTEERKGLCFRCEHRARFFESGRSPRFECGDVKTCVHGCYMYQPVMPVILLKNKTDKRPQFGPIVISARSSYAGMPDMELGVKHLKTGAVLYWDFI